MVSFLLKEHFYSLGFSCIKKQTSNLLGNHFILGQFTGEPRAWMMFSIQHCWSQKIRFLYIRFLTLRALWSNPLFLLHKSLKSGAGSMFCRGTSVCVCCCYTANNFSGIEFKTHSADIKGRVSHRGGKQLCIWFPVFGKC